jgi:RNA polymerase sigma-32 factor
VSDSQRPAAGGLVRKDALDRYFAEVGRHPLLTREEEHALAVRVREQGDAEAAERLVLSNLRLVAKIATEYRRVWTNLLDLIQEGNLGLLQAVRRFDPYRGVKLSSYAAYWIRAYILKYLIDNIRLVRVGTTRTERKLFFQLSRARRELERAGFQPEPALLAEKLDVDESEVRDMEHRLASRELSLDAPVSDESGAASLGEFIPAGGASFERAVADEDMKRTFRAEVERFAVGLGPREQKILRERVLADPPKTLQELGLEFGLTRERVRQLESKLVRDLRDHLKANLVDFDYWAPED